MQSTKICSSAKRGNLGFALIELMLAISIMSILAIYSNKELANRTQDDIARGGGVYLATVAQAAEKTVLMNFLTYEQGGAITGLVNPLQPTIPELIAQNRLSAGFPQVMPTRQAVRIDVTRTNCPGPNCQVTTLVCTTTPVTMGAPVGANSEGVRFDLATIMVEEQGGRGGQALITDGTRIRGPALNMPNPMGNRTGIVCGSSFVDVGMFNAFVRIGDTRDPSLQGPLTVAGPTNLQNTLTVGGAATVNNRLGATGDGTANPAFTVGDQANPCIRMLANGRASFACNDPNNLPAGYTGGVRSTDVVANANILTSANPSGFTGSNGSYSLLTANNGAGEAEIRTSGRAAADRLMPTGSYAVGAACAATDEGAISRLSGGNGLVTCNQNRWRLLNFQASAGDVCATEGLSATDVSGRQLFCVGGAYRSADNIYRSGQVGAGCAVLGSLGYDTANNMESLVCRINLSGGVARWMRLRDVTSHLVFVQSFEVAPNASVPKPVCNQAAGQIATPLIQMIPKVWGTPDGGNAFFAVDAGASWTVRMRDGAGNNLQGMPTAAAIVQIYCYFP